MIVPKVYPHSTVKIVAAVILNTRATIKAVPHMTVRINFSGSPGAFDETSMEATNMLDLFSDAKISSVLRAS